MFLLLPVLHQTVAQLKSGIYKKARQRLENMSWYICDSLLNPRRETNTINLIDDMRDHENEMKFLKEKVLENSNYETHLILDIYRNNSYTICDFFDFDIAKIRYEFCWNHGYFVHVHMFLTRINNHWYSIFEHLDKLHLINMTRTTTEFWPDIHGTTKPVNLYFHLSQLEKSEYDPIIPPPE